MLLRYAFDGVPLAQHRSPIAIQRQAAGANEEAPMSEKVEIKVRDNGSLRISGDFTIVDVEGNEIPHEGTETGLCRCGKSANKPFCDGSHKQGFESVVRAPQK